MKKNRLRRADLLALFCISLAPYDMLLAQQTQADFTLNTQSYPENLKLGARINEQATKELNELITKYQSFSANIEQSQFKSVAQTGKYTKTSQKKADFSFLKPFYFAWKYAAPNPQTIISDGQYIYIYQDSLNQLVKKEAKNILAQSPIQLIFNQKIDKLFEVKNEKPDIFLSKNAKWVDLLKVPKNELLQSNFFELKSRSNNHLYQNIFIISDEKKFLTHLIAQTALGITTFEFKDLRLKSFTKEDFKVEKHINVKEPSRS